MAAHERPAKSDEWYTPPYVFDAMGARFDMAVAQIGRSSCGGRVWIAVVVGSLKKNI